MSEIIVISDDIRKQETAAQELAEMVGPILATTYPGYRWRVEAYPHPTRPFVDIRLEHGGNCMVGQTIKPAEFPTASMFKKQVLKLGGELLEMFLLNRVAFNETEFVSRKKNFAGIIVPVGFDDTRRTKKTSTSIILA